MKKKSAHSTVPFDRARLEETNRQAIKAAENGDAFSTGILLCSAIQLMRKRKSLPPELADFVATFLEKVVGNSQLGRPPAQRNAERDFELAWDVRYALESGMTWTEGGENSAVEHVAKKNGVSENVVKHACTRFGAGTDFGPPVRRKRKIKGNK